MISTSVLQAEGARADSYHGPHLRSWQSSNQQDDDRLDCYLEEDEQEVPSLPSKSYHISYAYLYCQSTLCVLRINYYVLLVSTTSSSTSTTITSTTTSTTTTTASTTSLLLTTTNSTDPLISSIYLSIYLSTVITITMIVSAHMDPHPESGVTSGMLH